MSFFEIGLLLVWLAAVGFHVFSFVSLSNALQRLRRLNIVRRRGVPGELGDLDPTQLARATQDLQALGFVIEREFLWSVTYDEARPSAPLSDPTLPPPLAPTRFDPQGLERIFSHPQHGCWAGISFAAATDTREKRPTIINFVVSLSSSTGRDDDDWNYATRDRKYDANNELIAKLWRHPRWLATVVPDATAAQLLETHLERRDQIARATGVSWQRDLTMEDYGALEARTEARMRAVFLKLTPFQMNRQIVRIRRERDGERPEWLGELKGQLEP